MPRSGRWTSYEYAYGEDGRRAEVRFDVDLAAGPTPRTHGTCVRLVVPADRLADAERAAAELLGAVDGWLVAVLRYAAAGELVVQVEDRARFAAVEAELRARLPGLAVHGSAGWDYFTDRVCPRPADWQRIGDREACEAAVARGLDPEVVRPLEHGFVGDARGLDLLRSALAEQGLAGRDTSPGRLAVTLDQRLRPEEVSAWTVRFVALAPRCGVVYDGWRLATPRG